MSHVNNWMTLAEVRRHILEDGLSDDLLGLIKLGRQVRVRFVWVDDDAEWEDSAHWGVFKEQCRIDKAKIVIDDQGGGLRMRQPEKELT